MKYVGKPYALWMIFRKSFKENLVHVLDMSKTDAQITMKKGKEKI